MAIIRTYVSEGSMLYTKGHLATRNGTAKDRILPLSGRAGPARVGRGVASQGKPNVSSKKLGSRNVSDTERLRNRLTLAALPASPELVVPSGNVLAGRPERMVGSSLDRNEVP